VTHNDRSPDTSHLYAWLSRDADGIEGVVAAPVGNAALPLVFTDRDRAVRFTPLAQVAASARGFPAHLVAFSRGETLKEIQP
jgi:hypothetical protein